MLTTVTQVSKKLISEIGDNQRYTLQTIVNAIEAYTPIDEVIYVAYNVPATNPIWGQFLKYGRRPSVYSALQMTVEIRYATHLDESWRRFVVCKELCHSLDSDEGTHSVSDRSIERLLGNFALLSASKLNGKSFPAFDAEILAEVGALELLCPIQTRKQLINASAYDISKLCDRFGIPQEYGPLAFSEAYVEMVESLCY